MADPVSALAIGSTVATAVGGGVSAFGSIYGGEAKANMYRYQAGIADLNKRIADENADYAREVGEVKAQESGMKTDQQIGQTTVIQAARGLDVTRGSAVDVRESAQELGAFDQAIIRSDAARKAYGYQLEGAKATLEGSMYRTAADTSIKAGTLSAVGTLIGTAGSVASKWLQWGSIGSSGGGGRGLSGGGGNDMLVSGSGGDTF